SIHDTPLRACDLYELLAAHLGRRVAIDTFLAVANFHFQEVSHFIPADINGALPAVIQQSLHEEEALVNERSGHIVQRNASIVHIELDEALQRQGVILTALDTAVHDYPELVQQYFMT